MKVLITGGNGFIARSIKEKLESKYNLICCGRDELDLLDSKAVIKFLIDEKFDIVIHSATYDAAPVFSTNDPNMVLENNLRMFFNLARGEQYFSKLIYFGSGAEFNRSNWKSLMNEDFFDKHMPEDQYGFSKYIMNLHTRVSNKFYNLRLFGVFGKYDDWRYRFIPNICARAVLNLPIVLNQDAIYDYIHIDDLIQVVEWVIEGRPKYNTYNVCSGNSYRLLDLANKVMEIANKEEHVIIMNKSIKTVYSGDNKLLLEEFKDWKIKPIDDGIRELIDWYSENKEIFELGEYKKYM